MLDWSKKLAMGFNLSKFKIMHCGRNNQKAEYTMDGVKLKTVESERDIGVCITANMKPSAHCTDASNKDKAVLNQKQEPSIIEIRMCLSIYISSLSDLTLNFHLVCGHAGMLLMFNVLKMFK